VGDGNNMAHSLLLAGASVGAKVSIATPERYGLNPVIVTMAKAIADETKASLRISNDPRKAVAGADAVYTDAWASMGDESEAEERAAIFSPFQVNGSLMQLAKPTARFMHCLPAHRGQEVTDQVIDSLNSVVFDQAENRLHIQKAILVWLLGGSTGRFSGSFSGRSEHANA
jgi:ornithine carbamoyltransferase